MQLGLFAFLSTLITSVSVLVKSVTKLIRVLKSH